MPIGKNALKRVTNNGYSKVNTSAPDMENSEVIVENVVVTEKKPAPKKKTTTEKKTGPKTEAKKPATKKPAAPKAEKPEVKPAVVLEEKKEEISSHPDGFIKISFGMDMPVYLL